MAAEALGLGASVVAFIGLAGQIVSGCQLISNLLDDAQDAREDLRILSHEVKILQGSVVFFQNTPLLLEQNSTSKDILDTAKPIFEEIFKAIEQVQDFITKYNAKDSTWKDLKVAFKKQRLVKLFNRLQNAKASLHTLQQNANLTLGARQSKLGPEIQESLVTISSTLDSSQTVGWQTHGRTGEILQNLDHLRLNVDRSRPILLNIQDRMEDIRQLTMETNRKATELQSNLPIEMRRLESTIQNIRADVNANIGTASSMRMMENDEELYARPPNSLGLFNGHGLAIQNPKKKCVANTRTYRTYIGNLDIRSITTSQEIETISSFDNKFSRKTSTTTQRMFNIHFLPGFFRRGVFFSTIQAQFAGQPAIDMKLRVYNIVRPDALIVEACEIGDLSLVQRLFTDGLATPFDQLPDGNSLLNIVLEGIFSRKGRFDFSVRDLHRYYTLFEYLVDLGLDPGISRTLDDWYKAGPALQYIYLTRISDSQFEPIFTNLSRLVIERSLQNPFLDTRNEEIQRYEQIGMSQPPLLTRQSDWEIEVPREDTARIFYSNNLEFNSALKDDPTARSCRNWLSSMNNCTDGVNFVYRQLCVVIRRLEGYNFDNHSWLKSRGITFVECTHALYNWFALILEFGFDIGIDADDLLYFLDETGNLDLLRSLMLKVGRQTKEINDFLEAKDSERCASLVYQLANLGARHAAFPHDEDNDRFKEEPFSIYVLSSFYQHLQHHGRNYNYFKGELRYRHIGKRNWSDFVTKCSLKSRTSRALKIPFIKPFSRIRFRHKALYVKHSWETR